MFDFAVYTYFSCFDIGCDCESNSRGFYRLKVGLDLISDGLEMYMLWDVWRIKSKRPLCFSIKVNVN